MKNRVFAALLVLALVFSLLPATAVAEEETLETVTYYNPESGKTENIPKGVTPTPLSGDYTTPLTLGDGAGGWYYVEGDADPKDNRIEVSGTVNLILCDAANLNATQGIHVGEGSTLIIWGQAEGSALFTATGHGGNAAIGGDDGGTAGTITINGGTVNAIAADAGAGIGAGIGGGGGGSITINGGTVNAVAGGGGAGIDGTGSTVNINGGIVNASANGDGAGIDGTGGTVTINGGNVIANGDGDGAGIDGTGGTIAITGGVVRASSTGDTTVAIGDPTGGGDSTIMLNGNAVVYVQGSLDPAPADGNYGNMLLSEPDGNHTVYGNVPLEENLTVESDKVLTVSEGATLTVPKDVTLTVEGVVKVDAGGTLAIDVGGTLTIDDDGKVENNGRIVNRGTINGSVDGNAVENPRRPAFIFDTPASESEIAQTTTQVGGVAINSTRTSDMLRLHPTTAQLTALFATIGDDGVLRVNVNNVAGVSRLVLAIDVPLFTAQTNLRALSLSLNDHALTTPRRVSVIDFFLGGKSAPELPKLINAHVNIGSVGYDFTDEDGNLLDLGDFANPVTVSMPFTAPMDISTHQIVMVDTADGSIVPRSWFADGVAYAKVSKSGTYDAKIVPLATFSDTDGRWMAEAVGYMGARGIVGGVGGGRFDAEGTITRAHFVTMLMRALDLELDYEELMPPEDFADAPTWAREHIRMATALGLTLRDDDGNFNPSAPILRQEMFFMAYEAMSACGMLPEIMTQEWVVFDDWDDVNADYANALQMLAKLGLANGNGDGTLNPLGSSTRSEGAQFLYNLLKFDAKAE